jgi:hypothetical protein
MTDYDRPAEMYGREVPPQQEPGDELIVGRQEDEMDQERRDNPEAFATEQAADREGAEPEETELPSPTPETRPGAHASQTAEAFEPVFDTEHGDDVQQRWRDVQASFVDDPHDAVVRAGKLTDEVLSTLTSGLENRRRSLEQSGAEGDTEQLRIALRQYRLMLDHVLAL